MYGVKQMINRYANVPMDDVVGKYISFFKKGKNIVHIGLILALFGKIFLHIFILSQFVISPYSNVFQLVQRFRRR